MIAALGHRSQSPEEPVESQVLGPFPNSQRMAFVPDRKEYHRGLSNKILKGDKTNLEPAVEGIVPVVPHHEIVAGRHFENPRIIALSQRINIQCRIGLPTGQGLDENRDFLTGKA